MILRYFLGALFLLTSIQPGFAGLPDTYAGAAIGGRIVDGATGKPIEGAVVVASWIVSPTYYFHAPTKFKVIHLVEAVSDTNGNYSIPAWGPIERPSGWEKFRASDPSLGVFKPGFEPVFLENIAWKTREQTGPPFNTRDTAFLRSAHDAKDITLFKHGVGKKDQLGLDPSIGRTPEMALLEKLNSFAFFLERNVEYADEGDAPRKTSSRMEAMRNQRRAVLLVDDELKKVGSKHNWRTGIEFLQNK
jgi:hypothetical protein